MNLKNYFDKNNLIEKSEIEKVVFISYYFFFSKKKVDFNKADILDWFSDLNLTTPNIYRLISRIKSSKDFVKGKNKNSFQLHPKKIDDFKKSINYLEDSNEEIVSSGEIIPDSLIKNTRGYIEKISKQINSSYSNNIFDGCAVLMRRLIEILLILTYQYLHEEMQILDSSGKYKNLSTIINNAKNNKKINLSESSEDCIDKFRKLGNFSAHKIEYNCRKDDIKNVSIEYRATIEELLYKSGINK